MCSVASGAQAPHVGGMCRNMYTKSVNVGCTLDISCSHTPCKVTVQQASCNLIIHLVIHEGASYHACGHDYAQQHVTGMIPFHNAFAASTVAVW